MLAPFPQNAEKFDPQHQYSDLLYEFPHEEPCAIFRYYPNRFDTMYAHHAVQPNRIAPLFALAHTLFLLPDSPIVLVFSHANPYEE